MTPTRKAPPRPPSGHVFRVERKRGPQWYAKYRLPDGRQIQRKLGPAWTERGRPGGRLLHQAHGGSLAARRAGRSAARNAARPGQDRRDLRRRRRRSGCATSSTTAAASPRPSPATARCSTRSCSPSSARSRSSRSRRPRSRRGSAASTARPRPGPRRSSSCTASSSERRSVYGLPLNPVAEVEKPPIAQQRRHRGLLARGGHGAGPRRRVRAGRRDLPDRRLHRPAPRRAARAALARRGFRAARSSGCARATPTAR